MPNTWRYGYKIPCKSLAIMKNTVGISTIKSGDIIKQTQQEQAIKWVLIKLNLKLK